MKVTATVFDRFNPAAKRVVRAAEQASRNHNHYYLGVGHLLLALLEEHDSAVDARLADWGAQGGRVLGDVRRALGTGDDRLWEGIIVTPRVRSVVVLAESGAPRGEFVTPVMLLDAIVAEGGGLAAEILERCRTAAPVSGRATG